MNINVRFLPELMNMRFYGHITVSESDGVIEAQRKVLSCYNQTYRDLYENNAQLQPINRGFVICREVILRDGNKQEINTRGQLDAAFRAKEIFAEVKVTSTLPLP